MISNPAQESISPSNISSVGERSGSRHLLFLEYFAAISFHDSITSSTTHVLQSQPSKSRIRTAVRL
jgi:hypothetical protein